MRERKDVRTMITPANMTLADVLSEEQQSDRVQHQAEVDTHLYNLSRKAKTGLIQLCSLFVNGPKEQVDEAREHYESQYYIDLDTPEYASFMKYVQDEQRQNVLYSDIFGKWLFSLMAKMTDFHYKSNPDDPMPNLLIAEEIVDAGALIAHDINKAHFEHLKQEMVFVDSPQSLRLADVGRYWQDRGFEYGLFADIQFPEEPFNGFSRTSRILRTKNATGRLIMVSNQYYLITYMMNNLSYIQPGKFLVAFNEITGD